ncbi:hypothetical protein BDC45DRAFT_534338 [Circinella umbellata]|nr:hypothetical protein BDC45DRAFT_534338 [Circinella umbellata]
MFTWSYLTNAALASEIEVRKSDGDQRARQNDQAASHQRQQQSITPVRMLSRNWISAANVINGVMVIIIFWLKETISMLKKSWIACWYLGLLAETLEKSELSKSMSDTRIFILNRILWLRADINKSVSAYFIYQANMKKYRILSIL